MLRCTKISPGCVPVISLAGTRLSLQPIHKNSGVCTWARRSKYSGSFPVFSAAHALFSSNNFSYDNIAVLFEFVYKCIKLLIVLSFYRVDAPIGACLNYRALRG